MSASGQRPFSRFGSSALEHPWSAAWLLATLGFAVFFLALDPAFNVPDDPFIMFVLDGFFHGEPDYHTIYVSTLLTQAVREGGNTRALPFAAAVAEFGMLLRDTEADVSRWTALEEQLEALPAAAAGGAADRQQFRDLVDLAAGLRRLTSKGR